MLNATLSSTDVVIRSPDGVTSPSEVVWGTATAEQQLIRRVLSANIPSPWCLMYRYREPAIILGAGQRPDPQRLSRAQQQEIALVKRKSGGGAVLAGPELLSVSVFLPPDHAISKGSAVAAYQWIGNVWKQVLAHCGIKAQLPSSEQMTHSRQLAESRGTDWACYGQVAHGELLDHCQRKCLGVAQIRSHHGCALTCGLYLHPPNWSVLAQVIGTQAEQAEILSRDNASVQCLLKHNASTVIDGLPQVLHRHLSIAFMQADPRA